MEKKLFLLDAFALIYRAYYALIRSPRITSKGFNTSAIFGFCNTLNEILKKENPTHIAVCFDPAGPTFRHEAYEEYKANREKQPEDITLSIPIIKEIIEAHGIPVVEIEGFEADDIIGTLSRRAEKEGFITYMMTPDKDYGQLVTPSVFMYKPSLRGQDFEIRGVEQIKEKYGIDSPIQVIDLLALEGDSVDNIPGCPGIGPKTAASLIQTWGTVENLIENTNQLKGAVKDKIENNREQIIFSKYLATIRTDLDISVGINDLKRGEIDIERLAKIYEKLEFRSFLSRLSINKTEVPTESAQDSPKKESLTKSPGGLFDFVDENKSDTDNEETFITETIANLSISEKIISTLDDAAMAAEEILKNKKFGLSIKSVGENAMTACIQAISIAPCSNMVYYIQWPNDLDISRKEMLKETLLGKIFENKDVTVIGNDIKRTMIFIARENINWEAKYFDTSVAHYIINPEMRHSLPEIAHYTLKYDTIDYLTEPRLRKIYDFQPENSFKEILNEAAILNLKLYPVLNREVESLGMEKLLHEIELPLVKVLAAMEFEGVRIDCAELKKLSADYWKRLNEMESEVFAMAGCRFNVGSPSQVGEILFDVLKIDSKAKKTKKGSYSTTEEILEKYRSQHPIVDLILRIRQLKKLLTTYIDALPLMVNPATDKLHTTYNQINTSTGRLSSTNPNLQNIPVRGDDGREIRKAFIADKECLFLSADYSQIELRLMADFSKDPSMIRAFKNGEDIHADTASRIFHVPIDRVTDEQRRNAKTANFGIIYGISAFGLSERLGIPRSEAKTIIENYMASYPYIKQYIDDIIAKGREQGYVSTFTGRRRYIPEINSGNAVVRGYGERNAVNAPLQGSAADIIKIAMINIYKRISLENLKSTMIMQVHDELIFNVVPSELEAIKSIIEEEMMKAYAGDVSLTVSVGVGRNWLEAH